MKFDIKEHEKHSVFTPIEDKLTSALAPDFKSEIIRLSKSGKSLICDLKSVKYIDSSGLSCFLLADRLYREEKLSFVLCNVTESVDNLIKLTKLDKVLTKIETLSESVDYISFDNLEKNL